MNDEWAFGSSSSKTYIVLGRRVSKSQTISSDRSETYSREVAKSEDT